MWLGCGSKRSVATSTRFSLSVTLIIPLPRISLDFFLNWPSLFTARGVTVASPEEGKSRDCACLSSVCLSSLPIYETASVRRDFVMAAHSKLQLTKCQCNKNFNKCFIFYIISHFVAPFLFQYKFLLEFEFLFVFLVLEMWGETIFFAHVDYSRDDKTDMV